jgi:hypothetical protein
MADAETEWVVYRGPKSASFGQAARVRDPRKAWPLTEQFLRNFTVPEALPDQSMWAKILPTKLTCLRPIPSIDAAVAERRIESAIRLFGAPSGRSDGPTLPDFQWVLSEAQVPAAIEFVLDDDHSPKQSIGPTSLDMHYRFTWRDLSAPASAADRRSPTSTLGVYLGGRAIFLQPGFTFPAAWNSGEFRAFLTTIEPQVPFRFKETCFYRWLPPKTARSPGRALKLEKTWRDDWSLH